MVKTKKILEKTLFSRITIYISSVIILMIISNQNYWIRKLSFLQTFFSGPAWTGGRICPRARGGPCPPPSVSSRTPWPSTRPSSRDKSSTNMLSSISSSVTQANIWHSGSIHFLSEKNATCVLCTLYMHKNNFTICFLSSSQRPDITKVYCICILDIIKSIILYNNTF